MKRFLILIFCSNFAVVGCKDKHKPSFITQSSPVSFTTFEISYSNGWTPGFTILIDSNNVYFSPSKANSVYYGVLADSIFRFVDSAAIGLQTDSTIKSYELNCSDCSIVAIKLEAGANTIRYFKSGPIHPKLGRLVALLSGFSQKAFHREIQSTFQFETRLNAANGPSNVFSKSWPTQ